MNRPVLLDLFCGAGGAGTGYALAGFHVIGVDIEEQRNYPFGFIKADVMHLDLPKLIKASGATAIHASPPCQHYSPLNAYNKLPYPDLVAPTRDLLEASGLPWVMENVPQAPLRDPFYLCGSMFKDLPVYRHRGFETPLGEIWTPSHPKHVARCARNGYLPKPGQFMTISGGKHSRAWQVKAAEAMGVTWMKTIHEVCESIPPAYTRHIGSQMLAQLEQVAA